MTSPDNPDRHLKESSLPPQSPEEAVITLLKGLVEAPTNENFAGVQAHLDEKFEAAQTDVKAFRFIIKYLEELRRDHADRYQPIHFYDTDGILKTKSHTHPSPYEYTAEVKIPYYPKQSIKEKLAEFVLRRAPPEPQERTELRTLSVLDPLELKIPENWNDLVTKYMAVPTPGVMILPYKFSSDTSTNDTPPTGSVDDWEILKRAKLEYAKYQSLMLTTNNDSNYFTYEDAAIELEKIVKELNNKMGLVYGEDGFLVQESK